MGLAFFPSMRKLREADRLLAEGKTVPEVVKHLERIVAMKGTTPAFIRCDNGPELTANALRDWCRFSLTGTSYIEPGSPWENPFVESFGSCLRDELLSIE
jgi:putative transposase